MMGKSKPQKIHLVSLGCPKARVDSELMAGLLRGEGAELTEDAESADAIVVNTCAFLESATQESIDTILELAELKSDSCRKLVVAGCLAQRYGEQLATEMPEVDVFLGTNELPRIVEAVMSDLPQRVYLSEGSHLYKVGAPRVPMTLGGSTYLKIAEGCSRSCSFCIIPQIRGPQVSRSIADLTQEAQTLADTGMSELILIAQDLTSYGSDLGIRDGLERLLPRLNEIDELRWIRLQYCYPWNFTDRLIEIIQDCERVLPYVDMPLQHISDRILKSMRRNVRRGQQREIIGKLRDIEGMVLRSTFITGYPGETDAEFQELRDWLEEVEFDHLGVFTFSPEDGTIAAELPDQVPEAVKEERRDELMALQQENATRRNKARIGTKIEVLVDGPSTEHELVLEGRHYGQAPEIDGCVFLSFKDDAPTAAPGDFVRVEITEASPYDLVGLVSSDDGNQGRSVVDLASVE